MNIIYRTGTLEESVQVAEHIGEFKNKETVERLSTRLKNKKHLILVPQKGNDLLGFKVGYQVDETTFYSWFGGVSSSARKKGIAQTLLDVQERWVYEQGYKQIKVKSRNQFPSMLRLLIKNSYLIEKYEEKNNRLNGRIYFIKQLD